MYFYAADITKYRILKHLNSPYTSNSTSSAINSTYALTDYAYVGGLGGPDIYQRNDVKALSKANTEYAYTGMVT